MLTPFNYGVLVGILGFFFAIISQILLGLLEKPQKKVIIWFFHSFSILAGFCAISAFGWEMYKWNLVNSEAASLIAAGCLLLYSLLLRKHKNLANVKFSLVMSLLILLPSVLAPVADGPEGSRYLMASLFIIALDYFMQIEEKSNARIWLRKFSYAYGFPVILIPALFVLLQTMLIQVVAAL